MVLELEEPGEKQMKATIVEKPEGFAAKPIGRVTTADVEALIDAWKIDHKPNIVAGMYSTLRAVFSYAEKDNVIGKRSSPCRDIKEVPKWEKVHRPIHRPDDADLDDFVGVRSLGNDDLIRLADELGFNYGLMVWLGVYFGMRYQEAAGLTVGSVENLLQGEVKINQVLTRQGTLKRKTKTKAGDRNIVDRDLANEIAAHMARRGLTAANTDAFLFVNKRGNPLSYSSWRANVWIPALRRAGLAQKKRNAQYLGLHDLRSMNRSIMNAQGVDQTTARYRFGHAGDPEDRMDDLYSRTSPRQNRLASERIGAVLRRVPRDQQGKSEENRG